MPLSEIKYLPLGKEAWKEHKCRGELKLRMNYLIRNCAYCLRQGHFYEKESDSSYCCLQDEQSQKDDHTNSHKPVAQETESSQERQLLAPRQETEGGCNSRA